jgi:hypothetical protein
MMLTRRGVARFFMVATLAVAGLSAKTGSAAASDDPHAFVAAIYERYAIGGEGVSLDNAETVRALFEPRLAEMIITDSEEAAAIGDAPKLGADPFLDAQDWDIADIRVTADTPSPDRAEAHATFVNFGEPQRVDLELVRGEDGGWRIRDIHWAQGSLRGLYTH